MPSYDDYRELVINASDEQKLAILRAEGIRHLTRIQGYAHIISDLVEERGVPQMPDDFNEWCKIIYDGARELRELFEAVTDHKHRVELQQERKVHQREFGETLWKDAQEGIPELQPYESLRDAIHQVAKRLDLPNTLQSSDEIRIDDDFFYPGGIVYLYAYERRARIGTQKRDRDYTGYSIALLWLVDARNRKWDEHESLTPSLDEAVSVLHHWLVDKWDFQKLAQQYPWINKNQGE